jgi:hypothetical protein
MCLQKGSHNAERKRWPAVAGMQIESMKVFIRSTKNGWYYQEPSTWTPDQGAASDLEQVARAVERIFQARLQDVEILLCYDEPRYDLVLPVPASPSQPEPAGQPQAKEQSRPGEDNPPSTHRKKRPPL